MNILTEIGWSHKPGGARRLAYNILTELIALRPDHHYTVCGNTPLEPLKDHPVSRISMPPPATIPQVIWDQFLFPHWAVPRVARRCQANVVLFTNNYISLTGARPAVVFINDMTPFVMPDSFRRAHVLYQQAYFRLSARRAAHIITISDHSKADICRILSVPEHKVTVAPLASGLTPTENPPKPAAIAGPYILYVGAIHPRKNLPRLITAFARLKSRTALPQKLVIAGERLWMSGEFGEDAEYRQVADQIHFTGRVTDLELSGLYHHCDLFAYPSLYEGFGLPVLEAMTCGAPVLTSNVSSLPEVAGDAGVLVDPLDVEAIANGMAQVLENPAFAADLRQRGRQRALTYSWRKTAQIVGRVLESVAL